MEQAAGPPSSSGVPLPAERQEAASTRLRIVSFNVNGLPPTVEAYGNLAKFLEATGGGMHGCAPQQRASSVNFSGLQR